MKRILLLGVALGIIMPAAALAQIGRSTCQYPVCQPLSCIPTVGCFGQYSRCSCTGATDVLVCRSFGQQTCCGTTYTMWDTDLDQPCPTASASKAVVELARMRDPVAAELIYVPNCSGGLSRSSDGPVTSPQK